MLGWTRFYRYCTVIAHLWNVLFQLMISVIWVRSILSNLGTGVRTFLQYWSYYNNENEQWAPINFIIIIIFKWRCYTVVVVSYKHFSALYLLLVSPSQMANLKIINSYFNVKLVIERIRTKIYFFGNKKQSKVIIMKSRKFKCWWLQKLHGDSAKQSPMSRNISLVHYISESRWTSQKSQ